MKTSMRHISDGIENNDLELVDRGVRGLADRPAPSFFTMLKILADMGGSVAEFRERDGLMRTIAREIGIAAKLGKIDEAAEGLRRLEGVCAKCRSKYGVGYERRVESAGRESRQ